MVDQQNWVQSGGIEINQKPHPKGWGMLRGALRAAIPVFGDSEIV
jgi:hypothetical protein